jgi:hypothetical protein
MQPFSLEDLFAKIICEEYAGLGFHDGGRSDSAAHDIINILIENGVNVDAIDKARGAK